MWKVPLVSNFSAKLVLLSPFVTAHTPPPQQPNPWEAQPTRYQNASFNPDTYNSTGVIPGVAYAAAYDTQHRQASVPPPSDPYYTSHYQNSVNVPSSPPPTNTAYAAPSAVRGPRGPSTNVVLSPPTDTYSDSPPMYDSGLSREPGHLGTKG